MGAKDKKPRRAPGKPTYVPWGTPAEVSREHLAKDFETLLLNAKKKALGEEGTVNDLISLMRMEHPGPQRRVSFPELAALRPEDRITALNSYMLSGRIGLEDGKALILSAEREFSATVVAPLRAALMALRQGVTIEEVAARLARVGHRLALLDESRGRTIEGKADAE